MIVRVLDSHIYHEEALKKTTKEDRDGRTKLKRRKPNTKKDKINSIIQKQNENFKSSNNIRQSH